MRRYFKGIGFQIFMWIAAISMVILWVPGIFRSRRGRGEGWAAQVNGVEIGTADFKRSVMNHEAQIQLMRSQYGEYADLILRAMGMNPTTLAFDSLVQNELLNQAAQPCAFYLHPDFAVDMLSNPQFIQQDLADVISIAELSRHGGLDRRSLQVQLHQAGLSQEEFEHIVYRALERELLLQIIGGASYVPQFALQSECNKQFAAKKFDVLSCPFDRFLEQEKKKVLSDAELKSFFDRKNRENKAYWTPEKRLGKTWTFDQKSFNITVDDNEIERYYNDHLTEFVESPMQIQVRRLLLKIDASHDRAAVFKKAHEVWQEIMQQPDRFAQLAKEHSQDTESAKNGGLLPFFTKGSKNQAFERAALLLKNDGDVSDIVETTDGIEIIQRVSRKKPTYKSLSAVRAQIAEKLRNEKYNELFRQEFDSLSSSGSVNVEKLQEFIARFKGNEAGVEVVKGKDTGRVAQALLSMPEGETTYLIEDGKAIIVQLSSIVARHAPSLTEVKERVVADMHKELAFKIMLSKAQELKQKVTVQNASALAKENGFAFEQTEWIKPDQNERVEALKKRGVPVQLFSALEKVSGRASVENEKGVYLVILDAIEPVSQDVFVQKENILERQLVPSYTNMMMNGFVASLYRNATIKTNESLLHAEEDYSV